MSPKQLGALRKLLGLLPDKASYFSGTKIFLRTFTGIYRLSLSKCFENAVLGCLVYGVVQMFLLTSTIYAFGGKLFK